MNLVVVLVALSDRLDSIRIIDDDNEGKFAGHGLAVLRVLQVLDGGYVVVRNRKRRRGTFLILGKDHCEACIAIPIESTRERPICRPKTAWPCKETERLRLDRTL